MAKASLSVDVIRAEGKSHRTKAELAMRESMENELLSGVELMEEPLTKSNEIAHKEFERIKTILDGLGKNDDIFHGIVNRYCQMTSEVEMLKTSRDFLSSMLSKLDSDYLSDLGIDNRKAFPIINKVFNDISALDKQIDAKRKDLLSMEKEMCFTMSSGLRSIPKTPDKSKNALLDALNM